MYATTPFSVNGRTYQPPNRPVVVICMDGSADEYLDAALVRGRMPNVQQMAMNGYRGMARGALPSFTNVNNASLVTGVPPAVHGISGNFFLEPETGQEVMMNAARYLRAETLLAAAARAGRKVAMVTAKDKLREILSHGMEGIAFSAEKANQTNVQINGIADAEALVGRPTPPIYSPDASLFVLQAGVALLERGLADLLYLSLTDYMQHRYPPDAPEALDFYAAQDAEIGKLLALGAVVGATADHGMNAKQRPDGSPNVLYLEDLLREQYGPEVRVILPITDPYVAHHGALGSYAVVHLPAGVEAARVAAFLMEQEAITEVYDRATTARKLELPSDRIGDLAVMCKRDVVLGRTPAYHDLTALEGGLRSHGGRYEEMVPFLLSEPLSPAYQARAAGDLRNFDLFAFAMPLPFPP